MRIPRRITAWWVLAALSVPAAACDFGYQPLPELFDATGTDCEFAFLQGATYMVHAFVIEGRLVSAQSSRPILISLAEGEPARRDPRESATLWSPEVAIAHSDARLRGRPHAFVWGGPFEVTRDVTVHAERDDGEPITVHAPNTPWNVYELSIPPGIYRLSIRKDGIQVGDTVTLSLESGESRRVDLGPVAPR